MQKLVQIAILLVLTMGLAVSLSAAPKSTVGFAVGDYPFHIGKSEIRGNGTIFEGETVTSHHLPTQLNLQSGSRLLLGVGSAVQVFEKRVALQGGTIEIVAAGEGLSAVEAGGLVFRPLSAETRAIVYSDRPDVVSISVENGEVAVTNAKGEQIRTVEANSRAAFAHTQNEVKVERDERATLEIARIQARQIEHMDELSSRLPAMKSKTAGMLGLLAAASGGYIGGSAGGGSSSSVADTASRVNLAAAPSSTAGLAAPPEFNALALEEATSTVNQNIFHPELEHVGCGEQTCQTFHPLNTNNLLFGHTLVGGVPLFGGFPGICFFCSINVPFPQHHTSSE